MKSYEEKVEDYFKNQLRELGIEYKTKTEPVNKSVDDALSCYQSKSGGSGKNYPDIKLLLSSDYNRSVPVMIEVKGALGALVKYVGENSTEIDHRRSAVQRFAVNGAIHYALGMVEAVLVKKLRDTVAGNIANWHEIFLILMLHHRRDEIVYLTG